MTYIKIQNYQRDWFCSVLVPRYYLQFLYQWPAAIGIPYNKNKQNALFIFNLFQ